jgi:hypothetical protein
VAHGNRGSIRRRAVTQITCQGTVTGTNIPSTPTDNPGTATPGDPTVISVQPPVLPVPTLNEWGLLVLLTSLLGSRSSRSGGRGGTRPSERLTF